MVHADRVQLLDMTTGKNPYEPLRGHHAGDLWSANFSLDSQRLATGGGYEGKGEVRIWEAADWEKSGARGSQPPD